MRWQEETVITPDITGNMKWPQFFSFLAVWKYFLCFLWYINFLIASLYFTEKNWICKSGLILNNIPHTWSTLSSKLLKTIKVLPEYGHEKVNEQRQYPLFVRGAHPVGLEDADVPVHCQAQWYNLVEETIKIKDDSLT
jgi:hypothetical protein